MRSRTNEINVWLSDEELADLNEKGHGRVRGSVSEFIRQVFSGRCHQGRPLPLT